ncbi:ATP-binding cassette domain-containing protein [Numidum massiliense]|uniref:ATP-binding cassette domain-containing protein n=1 Tax=Numidum massiliense TaxID=1522315 RepID=UPI0006D5ADEA|nr:ABC transporter ATP-binding protein [Numidum massiliense]
MIDVQNVAARVADHIAYTDLNFHVASGEAYGILGDAGSGKTELIQLLSGVRSPESGKVTVANNRVYPNILEAQQYIGVVTRSLALFRSMTVEDNLMFWGRLLDLKARHSSERIEQRLEQVGFTGKRDDTVKSLPLLEQKKVHLAAALLHDPKVLMLDQPTERMRPKERESFLQVVSTLQQGGLTLLYATDRVDEVQRVARRVAIMDGGKILAEGTVEELRGSLGGQSQVIVRSRPLEALISYVEQQALVHTVDREEDAIRIWTSQPKQLLLQMFSEWQQTGVVTESVKVVEPTLAGVYLHLTGKSLDGC